jgi:hypothetical protein
MKIHKRTALTLSGVLAATSLGALALAASPAQAASVSSAAINGAPDNKIAGATVWYDDGNSTKSPTNPGPNTTISLTAVQSGANVDYTVTALRGPSVSDASPVAAGTSRLDAFVRLDGADGNRGVRTPGPVDPDARDYTNPAIRYSFPGGATITGSFTGVAAGSHTLTLTDFLLDSSGAASGGAWGSAADGSDATGFDAWFNNGTTATQIVDGPVQEILAETINIEGPEVTISGATVGGTPVPASSPQVLKGGEIVTFQGNDQWNAGNNNITLRMCAPGTYGTGSESCSPSTVSTVIAANVSTDTTGGVLTTVRGPLVNSGGFGAGLIDVVVEQRAPGGPTMAVQKYAIVTIQYNPKVADPGTITGPATVSPGATNNLSGTGWYPGETVTITAGSNSTTAVANAAGNISASLVVSDTSATAFNAAGIGQTATSPFALSADSCTVLDPLVGCDTSQSITAEVTAGELSQAAAITGDNTDATLIDMGTTETSVSGDTLTGDLNTITVTDNRGGLEGWSLTAEIDGPLTAGGGATISEGNLSGTPTCTVAAAGSATGVSTGGLQDYSGAVNLCTKDTTADSDGDTTSGQYTVTQPLSLVVPAFQAAGTYNATITITLI